MWHFCRSPDVRKLERVQERALRAAYNDKSVSYEELLNMAKLPTLQDRRLQDHAILTYKVKNELCALYMQELFKQNTDAYDLRNTDFNT